VRARIRRLVTPHSGWREIPVEAWAAATLGLAWSIFFGAAPFHPWQDLAFAAYGFEIVRRYPAAGRMAFAALTLAVVAGTLFLWLPAIETVLKKTALLRSWGPGVDVIVPTFVLATLLGIVIRSPRAALTVLGIMAVAILPGAVVFGRPWWSAPLAGFFHVAVLIALLRRLAALRRIDGTCPICGYDARELERCPECGSLVPPAEE